MLSIAIGVIIVTTKFLNKSCQPLYSSREYWNTYQSQAGIELYTTSKLGTHSGKRLIPATASGVIGNWPTFTESFESKRKLFMYSTIPIFSSCNNNLLWSDLGTTGQYQENVKLVSIHGHYFLNDSTMKLDC